MLPPKNDFKVKYFDDSEGDGHWEIVNDKGGLTTTEDYEGIEQDLKNIADALNKFEGQFRVETALELRLHCDHQMAKMELDRERLRSGKLREALFAIRRVSDQPLRIWKIIDNVLAETSQENKS